jgi:HlyD family secretion protein
MKKAIIIVVLLIAVGGGAYYYWQTSPAGGTAETIVETYTQMIDVQRGNIIAGISPVGELIAPQYASLSFIGSLIPIADIRVTAGQVVEEGDVLARLETASLERSVDQAEAALLTAEENLADAQAKYSALDLEKLQLAVTQAEINLDKAKVAREELLNPDLEAAEQAILTAQYNLQTAEVNLELAQVNSGVTSTIRDLEYAVAWHERNVRDIENNGTASGSNSEAASAALAQVARPGGGPSVEPMTLEEAQTALADAREELVLAHLNAVLTLAKAEDKVADAEKALADAEETLADLQAGPSALELAKADNSITQAELKLTRAQADLEDLLAGTAEKTVKLAQARYNSAVTNLAEAQAALEESTMVAPFRGTIISVLAEAGDEVSTGQVIVTMANLDLLRVIAYVDETEISQVQVGQTVDITFDAYSGYSFWGEVLEAPIQGQLVNNVVTYEVIISLEGLETAGISLKTGLTANLMIRTAHKDDVLLLPVYAVQATTDGKVVTIQNSDGTTSLVPVRTGVTDGTYIEIVGGLNEGDTVVAAYQEQAESEFSMMGGGFMMGGGGGAPPPGGGR